MCAKRRGQLRAADHVVGSHTPYTCFLDLFVIVSLDKNDIVLVNALSRSQPVSPVAFNFFLRTFGSLHRVLPCWPLTWCHTKQMTSNSTLSGSPLNPLLWGARRRKTSTKKQLGKREAVLTYGIPWGTFQVSAVYDSHNLKLQRIEQDYVEEVLQFQN